MSIRNGVRKMHIICNYSCAIKILPKSILFFKLKEVLFTVFRRMPMLILLFSFLIGSELDEGIMAYNKRAEGAKGVQAAVKPIDIAIRHFENVLKISSEEEQAAVYLLKCYYFKGTYVLTADDAKKEEYNRGKILAEKMITKYPNSAPLRYWYLTCLGKWAEVYGILAAAKEGVADLMKAHAEAIIRLDKEYEDGGGYFMLGVVHYKSPYIPFILSWPDNDEAIAWLRQATETGKATAVQKNYLARALLKDGKKDAAKKLLKEIINSPLSTANQIEDLFEKNVAKELLEDNQ